MATGIAWLPFGDINTMTRGNALGQQVSRTVGSVVTLSVHDLNGNRIAEHDGVGAVIREYIWLDGRPLAVIEGGVQPATIFAMEWRGEPCPTTIFCGRCWAPTPPARCSASRWRSRQATNNTALLGKAAGSGDNGGS